jgi:hypothetical protein
MRSTKRFLLAAALAVTTGPVVAQAPQTLSVDDLVGVWDMRYEDGQAGKFTISKNDDGTPKIIVSTAQGGQSAAHDVVFAKDTVAFARDITLQGQSLIVTYTAKHADGKLLGSAKFNLGNGSAMSFTATRAD